MPEGLIERFAVRVACGPEGFWVTTRRANDDPEPFENQPCGRVEKEPVCPSANGGYHRLRLSHGDA